LKLILEKRQQRSKRMALLSPVLAIALTIATGAIIFAMQGLNPAKAIFVYFIEPLTSVWSIEELIVKAAPLVLIGVGLALCYQARVWNIGAEGQLTIGALAGSIVPVMFNSWQSPLTLITMLLLGMLGGAAYAAIPAFLKTRFNANEILTSLMLTYVATLLLSYLVHGPLRDPDGYNFPESRLFHEAATLPIIWDGTRLHLGWLLAIAFAVITWVLLSRTLIGFQVKVVGSAPQAARYAGFSQNRMIWFALLLGGGAAGLAGIIEVSGPIGQLLPVISPGYGFTAIIVAFLGRLHPIGVVFAGLLMALSYLGGESLQIGLNLPLAVTDVFQGMLLFFLLWQML